jgi:hypothetical protein
MAEPRGAGGGSPGGVTYSDRFIPSRTGSNLASYMVELGEENAGAAAHSSEREARACAACSLGGC